MQLTIEKRRVNKDNRSCNALDLSFYIHPGKLHKKSPRSDRTHSSPRSIDDEEKSFQPSQNTAAGTPSHEVWNGGNWTEGRENEEKMIRKVKIKNDIGRWLERNLMNTNA